jgi:multicomponent Na+:H+ antiporter subunit B
MREDLSLIFYLLAILAAIVALNVKDLLAAAVVLSLFSFLAALLYIVLGAVDVGFNEAVLGAGVTGVLFVVTIFNTHRRSRD